MKRFLKYTLLSVLLLLLGFVVYGFFIYPAYWHSIKKRDSVSVLRSAKGTNELMQAVGSLGLFLSLTNGGWVAIRYRDSHGGGIRSSAVALDSEGNWFESDRHFCGSLRFWPRLKDSVSAEEEQRKLTPEYFTNRVSRADSDNGMFPSYQEMMAVEAATNMASAREALQAIGFKPLIK